MPWLEDFEDLNQEERGLSLPTGLGIECFRV